MNQITLSTTEIIYGKKIIKHVGLVRGTSIRSRHLGHDILAKFRGLVGGEIHEYTKLMAESREQVLERMINDAKSLGANAIVGIRFTTSQVAVGAAELMVYGTAVEVENVISRSNEQLS